MHPSSYAEYLDYCALHGEEPISLEDWLDDKEASEVIDAEALEGK